MGKYCRLLSACLHPGHPRFCLGRGSRVRPDPMLSLPKPNESPRRCRPPAPPLPPPLPALGCPRGAERAGPRPGPGRGRSGAAAGRYLGHVTGRAPLAAPGAGRSCGCSLPAAAEERRALPSLLSAAQRGPGSSLRRGPARPLPWSQR